MSATAPIWVRVGGGMESVPDHLRHGAAEPEFPPRGGRWEALLLNGRLVGWAEHGGLRVARQSAEIGQRLAHEQRDYLLARLGHKLRSSVLALQESARQAAFGRPEMVEGPSDRRQEGARGPPGPERPRAERRTTGGASVRVAPPTLARPAPRTTLPPAG